MTFQSTYVASASQWACGWIFTCTCRNGLVTVGEGCDLWGTSVAVGGGTFQTVLLYLLLRGVLTLSLAPAAPAT